VENFNILTFLLTNLLNGIMGITMLLLGFFIFDRFTPNWDFTDAFKTKGFSGGAIVVAAYLISLSIIVAATGF